MNKNPQAVLDVLEFYSLPDGNSRLFDYGKLNDGSFVHNEMQSLTIQSRVITTDWRQGKLEIVCPPQLANLVYPGNQSQLIGSL
jgi:hypothetical protein